MDLPALPLPLMALGRQSRFELTQESHHMWYILIPGVLHMTHFQWGWKLCEDAPSQSGRLKPQPRSGANRASTPGAQVCLLEAASSALHIWFVTSLCCSMSSSLLDLICRDATVGQRASLADSSHLSPCLRQGIFVGFWLFTTGPESFW